MKKTIKLSFVIVAVAMLFASCKSHEKCPAYGMHKTHVKSGPRG